MADTSTSSNHCAIACKDEPRSSLYYNQFEYKMSFELYGAFLAYYAKNMTEYEANYRRHIKEISQWRADDLENGVDKNQIGQYLNWRQHHRANTDKRSFRIVSSRHSITVFTSNTTMIKELFDLGFDEPRVYRARACIPTGVKYYTRLPRNTHRTYFKDKRVDENWKSDFKQFLKTNTQFKASNALHLWLNNHGSRFYTKYLRNSHYVEYDGESNQMLLSIYFGFDFIGQHYELRHRDELLVESDDK